MKYYYDYTNNRMEKWIKKSRKLVINKHPKYKQEKTRNGIKKQRNIYNYHGQQQQHNKNKNNKKKL